VGRTKGSKNKPKSQDTEVRDVPEVKSPEVQEFKPDGLFINNKQAQLAKDCNFRVNFDNKSKRLLTESSGQDSYKAFVAGEKVIKDSQIKSAYGSDPGDRYSGDAWRGGTLIDIKNAEQGKFDLKPFYAQKEKLQKTFGSLEFLEAALARKRVRFLSEYDGELDFDRLYEREPFHNTRISNSGIARVMDINVDFTFSAGVNANEIMEYGTMAWAIMDILEKAGIRCNVFINTLCAHQSSGGKLQINDYETRIKIKSTEEYMDTSDLARHFTPNYYRRVIFGTWCLANEAIGREMSYGFGNVKHWERKTTTEKGVLNLAISQMKDFKLDSNKLVDYIREAL
tara:strand:- start:2197 stop:3216 length:1020 start_codon:yes stop_codon:yes gene_type:complete